MTRFAIIGGTGLTKLDAMVIERQRIVVTPYGEPSAPLTYGTLNGHPIVFLPRHGAGHSIPPHQVNYRANLWAIRAIGITKVVSIASVGGITQPPKTICIPDQIIDYTWGREHTFVNIEAGNVKHIDFTEPYCEQMRQTLLHNAAQSGISVLDGGTYGATQGPRLETAMEIRRMKQDGCDLVGMTGMPEAALAREIDLCYASCCIVVNWAAGLSEEPISMDEIRATVDSTLELVMRVVAP